MPSLLLVFHALLWHSSLTKMAEIENNRSAEVGAPLQWLLVVCTVIVGTWLRLFAISDQVLMDDEWHGFYYVIGKSFSYLLTHFSIPGATCPPLHVYYHWLLTTVGWSEVLLVLPSVVAGIASLVVFPRLLRGILSPRAIVMFCCLMAISPLLIYYSRFCRPYSPELLFGFTAIMSAYHWAVSGTWRTACLTVLCGVAAVYFHLFGIIVVVVPLGCVGLFRLAQSRWPVMTGVPTVVPSLWRVGSVLVFTLGLIALLVLPAFVDSARTSLNTVAGEGSVLGMSLWAIVEMLFGTANVVLVTAGLGLLVAGVLVCIMKDRLLGVILVLTLMAFPVALAISTPQSMDAAIVLCRYCIPVVPVLFLFIAAGLDRVITIIHKASATDLNPRATYLGHCLAVVYIAGLLWTGPLRATYARPNGFTGHSVFQHSYRTIDWSESYCSDMTPPGFQLDTTIGTNEVSTFYSNLAREAETHTIIEFPMLVGDHFNPYYFYQHLHGKRVMIGYTMAFTVPMGLAGGNVFGNTYIDEILSLVSDPRKLRFRNMVNLDNAKALPESGADYVVIHKRFEAELSRVAPAHPCIPQLIKNLTIVLGRPCFEDDGLVAFRCNTPALASPPTKAGP
jgi:hypothetical protein